MPELMYRYEDVSYASVYEGPSTVKVELRTFEVVRRTPKGAWIAPRSDYGYVYRDDERFVLTGARRRYACPTIEEARASFLARKLRQIRILKAQIAHVEAAFRDLEKQNPATLRERLIAALKERPMRCSELLAAAAVADRRAAEDEIHALRQEGVIVFGGDSVMRLAAWEPGRPIQAGDKVTIDGVTYVCGEP